MKYNISVNKSIYLQNICNIVDDRDQRDVDAKVAALRSEWLTLRATQDQNIRGKRRQTICDKLIVTAQCAATLLGLRVRTIENRWELDYDRGRL